MPEQNAEFNQYTYQHMVAGAERRAAEAGLDLKQAIRNNYGPDVSDEVITQRAEQINDTAAGMATDLQLESSFFERPANTIMLLSVADTWLNTDKKIRDNPDHATNVADERAMLVDTILMMAGDKSQFARDLATANQPEANRYIATSEEENDDDATRTEYIKSLEDPQLAAQLKGLLADDGDDSILGYQRRMFGITSETEEKFDIKVLKMGSRWDLVNAGFFSKVEWPDFDKKVTTEEERQTRLTQSMLANEQNNAQVAIAAEYEDAADTYKERFGAKRGPLAPAFAHYDSHTGITTMYLQAPEAIALVQHAAHSFEGGEPEESLYQRALATFQHEYAHTQKRFMTGAQNQLGLLLEERKAELASHDRLGYEDVKYVITDISMINGAMTLDGIEAALKESDSLSSFLIWSSNNLGLRNTLLLMASKPAPYDSDPHRAEQFPNMKAIRRVHGDTIHDAVVGENLDTKGDDKLKASAATWAGRLVAEKGIDFASIIKRDFVDHRKRFGFNKTAPYIEKALDDAVASHEEDEARKSTD